MFRNHTTNGVGSMAQKPDDHQKELVKLALKEGIKEWLSEQMAVFGWWSLKGIGAIALGTLVYLWLASHGWKAPNVAP